MSDDLVQRLRDGAYGADMEAADRIEELEATLVSYRNNVNRFIDRTDQQSTRIDDLEAALGAAGKALHDISDLLWKAGLRDASGVAHDQGAKAARISAGTHRKQPAENDGE